MRGGRCTLYVLRPLLLSAQTITSFRRRGQRTRTVAIRRQSPGGPPASRQSDESVSRSHHDREAPQEPRNPPYRRIRESEQEMSNKLFVGGLSWDTDDTGLRDAFQPFGDVREAKVITDRDTGRSRGFGFVTYANDSEAGAAIEAMNGAMLDGRSLRVDSAQDRGGRRGGGGGGGGGGRDRY